MKFHGMVMKILVPNFRGPSTGKFYSRKLRFLFRDFETLSQISSQRNKITSVGKRRCKLYPLTLWSNLVHFGPVLTHAPSANYCCDSIDDIQLHRLNHVKILQNLMLENV